MDEIPNVNNLNSVPNFGHGLPPDGVVIAGVTDVPQEVVETVADTPEETKEVPVEEAVELSEDNQA